MVNLTLGLCLKYLPDFFYFWTHATEGISKALLFIFLEDSLNYIFFNV